MRRGTGDIAQDATAWRILPGRFEPVPLGHSCPRGVQVLEALDSAILEPLQPRVGRLATDAVLPEQL